jgi:hypothetical protein
MKTTRTDWLIPAGLIVPARAGDRRHGAMAQLAGATVTPENARFFAAPLPVMYIRRPS